jgi:PAS domain S-box-containing protein
MDQFSSYLLNATKLKPEISLYGLSKKEISGRCLKKHVGKLVLLPPPPHQRTGQGKILSAILWIGLFSPMIKVSLSIGRIMAQSNAHTILIVEDEALIAMSEKMLLEKYGYRVITASSGKSAVEKAESMQEIDLVLMDIDLGQGMRGTEAASIILSRRDIPVVFLSSHTEREIVEQTEGITSYGYVVKNSGETVLIASIRMAFRLFETRRLVSDTFNHSINGICIHRIICDTSGALCDCEYLQVNSAFERHTGLSASSLTGRTIKDIYPGDEAADVIKLYDDILAGRAGSRQEIFFPPMGFWFELSLFPTREDEFTVVVNNITKRKNTEKDNRVLADIVRRSKDFIGVADPAGKAFFVNPAGQAMVGLDGDEEAARTQVRDYFFPEDLEFVEKTIMPEVMEKGRWAGEFRFRHFKTGKPVFVDYDLFLTEDPSTGIVQNLSTISRDITSQKLAEERVARHQWELQEIQRIGSLANATLDPDAVLNLILEQTVRALKTSVGMIFLHQPETGALVWAASAGLSKAFVEEFRRTPIRMGEGLTGTIARTQEPIFIAEDSSHDPRIERSVVHGEGLHSFLGVPIVAGDQLVGVMNILTRPPERLSEDDVHFCAAIGSQVGWAIVNARLYARQKYSVEGQYTHGN